MGAAGEKLGNVTGKLGKRVGKMGVAFRKMGTGAFVMGKVVGKKGMSVGKLGTVGGELGTMLRNWGWRLGKRAADGSGSVLGVKILRSGRNPFARWLSIETPANPRFLMACGMTFVEMPAGVKICLGYSRSILQCGCGSP